MSWQAYVDTMKSNCENKLQCAGIFGVAGGAWAADGIDLSVDEASTLTNAISNQDQSIFGGFTLNGQKFAATRLDDDFVCGKGKGTDKGCCWDKGEVVIYKTEQALHIAVGGITDATSIKATQILAKLHDICEPLKEQGY